MRSTRFCVMTCLWLVLLPLGAHCEDLPDSVKRAVDAAVETKMTEHKLVGVAVGIVFDGRVQYLKGYGLADREHNIPVTTKTVFNWASVSKTITAVAAMQLADTGQLDLNADVRSYVPEFPDKGKVITMRHLLSHQSGLPHYARSEPTDSCGMEDMIVTPTPGMFNLEDPVQALNTFNRSPLRFDPGSCYQYSTYAYILASAVIQHAGRQPFAEQIQQRIVRPLAMDSFQYDVAYAGQPHWAAGYTKRDGEVVRVDEYANDWKHGGGGFKSNVEDLTRFAEALANKRLVSDASYKLMWTRLTDSGGIQRPHGLGFRASDENTPSWRAFHGGSQTEVKTHVLIVPETRQAIVVMCNSYHANPGDLAAAVDAVVPDEAAITAGR